MIGTPGHGGGGRRRGAAVPPPQSAARLSARRLAGYALLAVCALAWAAIALLPWFGVSLAEGAALATVLLVVGEGAFVIGVALLGRDILARLRTLIDSLRDRAR